MAKIHLIDGEKGGVGKSFFAKTMIEYFLADKLPYTLIDADLTNPDVHQLYPQGAHTTVFSDLEKKSHHADLIFESALKKPVIVNLPAQVSHLVKGWIERNNLLDLAAEHDVEICQWFVCNGSYSSVNLFKESLAHYQDGIIHILVKNLGLTDDWRFLEEDVNFNNLLGKYPETTQTIEFPLCPYQERYSLEQFQLTLSEAFQSDQFTILSKQRLQIFQKRSFAAIKKTGLIEKQKAVAKSQSNNAKRNNSPQNNSPTPVSGQISPTVEAEKLAESTF